MISLALSPTVCILYFTMLAMPLSASLGRPGSRRRALFPLLLAPACGMALYMGAGVWLHDYATSGPVVFPLLLGLATIGIAVLLLFGRLECLELVGIFSTIAIVGFFGIKSSWSIRYISGMYVSSQQWVPLCAVG